MPPKEGRSLGKREIGVVVAIVIAVGIYFHDWALRWTGGIYYYNVEYIKAALGDGYLEEKCASVLLVTNPWKNLVAQDWFKLQRCAGNRD
jgi:hypothetical protein